MVQSINGVTHYLEKISAIILSRHLNYASRIILVNDRYDLINSIKDDEYDRCAEKYPNTPNVFPKPEQICPTTPEFSLF